MKTGGGPGVTAPDEPTVAADLLDRAVDAGLLPGAVLVTGRGMDGPRLVHVTGDAQRDAAGRRPMAAGTVFDLASVTKVVATLPVVLHLLSRCDVGLDDPVARYLPAFTGPGKAAVTVRHLLTHTSGLPDHPPYHTYLHQAAEIRAAVLAEPLVAAPGTVCAYSNIGFITLGELAAAVTGCGLAGLTEQIVCGPLEMTRTRYRPPGAWAAETAATEPVRGRAVVGVVHDENAAALGGVAGHAGLFATAADLGRYAAAWAAEDSPLTGAGVISPALRHAALRCHTEGLGGRRGFGWGLRGDPWDNMGPGWPASGAGQTGFTGTSLSVDPRSGLWAVLLTNAVHFGRGPEHSVVGLRKQVHAAVAAAASQPAAGRPGRQRP